MSDISFTSTYRIPLTEWKVTPAKRTAIKDLALKYTNHLYPNGNKGYVRVSVAEAEDNNFERELQQHKVKIYQKFSAHNVDKNFIDDYIKEELINKNYKQYGKH